MRVPTGCVCRMSKKHSLTLTVSLADQQFARAKSVGIFNLAMGLARRLAGRADLAALAVLGNCTLDAAQFLPPVQFAKHDVAIAGRLARWWWDQWGVYAAAQRVGHEWLLLPKGFASFSRRPPVKLCAYVHDAMLDFYRRNHPGGFPKLEQIYFQRALRASIRHARIIFTNTEFTAREVQRVAAEAGLAAPIVARAGIGFERVEFAASADRRGFVVLASSFPHKLTARAVDWVARWQQQTGFAEGVTWVGNLPRGLTLPALAGWRQHGRLPEAEYRQVLRGARGLVFFSEYEGFGMPPVEAVLGGACPVYSELPPTLEVMGGAGCGFANDDYESFARAMNRAREISPEQLARWAAELLARHNWDGVAERIMAGLQRADGS